MLRHRKPYIVAVSSPVSNTLTTPTARPTTIARVPSSYTHSVRCLYNNNFYRSAPTRIITIIKTFLYCVINWLVCNNDSWKSNFYISAGFFDFAPGTMSESPRIDVTGNDDDDDVSCCNDRGSSCTGSNGTLTNCTSTAAMTAGNGGGGGGRESPAVKSSAAPPYTSFSISSILSKDKPGGGGKLQHKNIVGAAMSPATAAAAAAAAATFDVTAHLAAAADHAMLSR